MSSLRDASFREEKGGAGGAEAAPANEISLEAKENAEQQKPATQFLF